MAIEIDDKFLKQFNAAYFVWFTTVREDGMPQPTPVWFIYESDAFWIYSQPTAQKVRNILKNPKVALNFAADDEGEDFFVVMGEAQIVNNPIAVNDNKTYLAKYDEGIVRIGFTREGMSAAFSTLIRVTPAQVRGL